MKGQRATALLFASPWVLAFGLFWAFPLVYSLLIGFTNHSLFSVSDLRWVGFDNYVALFEDEDFIASLKNTFIFVFGTIPITTIVSLTMAVMVNRQFRGRGFFRAGFFLPSITSMVVIALIFTNLYSRGGYVAMLASMVGLTPPEYGFLYNNHTALYAIMAMDIWMSVGYYMLIFLAGLKAIPDELYEAAEVAGASWWQQFTAITIPMLRPVALYVLVINCIKSFQVFVEIFVMTKGKFDTQTMVYFIYEKGLTTGFQSGYASAAAYVLFVIVGLFSILLFGIMRKRGQLW
jgi:multiple sugar transport system permease protein